MEPATPTNTAESSCRLWWKNPRLGLALPFACAPARILALPFGLGATSRRRTPLAVSCLRRVQEEPSAWTCTSAMTLLYTTEILPPQKTNR